MTEIMLTMRMGGRAGERERAATTRDEWACRRGMTWWTATSGNASHQLSDVDYESTYDT